MTILKFALSAAAFGVVAQGAAAGGYTPVVVEPVLEVAPAIVTSAGDWQGGYGGLTLGYAFGGDDDVGLSEDGAFLGRLGNAELKGANVGARIGYRWQRNKWVVGPELSIEGGNVKDSFTSGTTDVESKLKSRAALVVKTGYEVQPNMLAYGIAGVSRGSFDYDIGALSKSYDANGYVLGLGVERKVSDRMSVTGEVERNYFKKQDLDLGAGITTAATPSYTNVKLGLNFKF